MSDYIYNNFSSEDDKQTKEPVNIYFEVGRNSKKKKDPKNIIIAVCCICVLLCLTVSAGGTYFANYLYGLNNDSPDNIQVVENVVYTSQRIDSVETSVGENSTYHSISDVAAAVADTVVEIKTEFIKYSAVWNYQYVESGAGSGVIIGKFEKHDENGNNAKKGNYIITNAHVIQNSSNSSSTAEKITVTLRDGSDYEATLKGYDADYDIAILEIYPEKELHCALWINDQASLAVGEQVIAIGNPLGSLGGSVTDGIVSALSREVSIDGNKMNLIQTNATINPGNSGGGLFNMNGELIGIVNAKSTGTNIEGIGFAIPKKDAKKAADDIIKYGYVKDKPYIGVIYGIYNQSSKYYGYYGIINLEQGYNDDILKVGDIITHVNGVDVKSSSQDLLSSACKSAKVGDKITLTVLRDRKSVDLEITVFEYHP